jgi:alpha-amylase
MDFETFGEHQWAETGIFRFMHDLPGEVFRQHPAATFLTPTQAIETHPVAGVASVPRPVSWADASRDLSAWRGNAMQVHALEEAYRLGRRLHAMLAVEPRESVRAETLRGLKRTWRWLTTSDHFYYMSTKGDADGAVHAYFRAFESPYDACIAYMNVLKDLEGLVEAASR